MTELHFLSAVESARLLRSGEIGAVELVDAYLRRVEKTNPVLNAIVTLDAEGANEQARASQARLTRGCPKGPLEGLPLAVKDSFEVAGVRTTFGSPAFAKHMPRRDDLIVSRERAAGAVLIGKTNVPEFSLGAQTANRVFGATGNPYDPARSVSGSGGGGAAALAGGMAALADGSDNWGSLRSPAGWCNVVGFRPTPGRVPILGAANALDRMTVHGPMARTVADAALLLAAICGPDPRSAVSYPEPGSCFAAGIETDLKGTRIGWSGDLGFIRMDGAVAALFEQQRAVFEDLGCEIVEHCPDLGASSEIMAARRTYAASVRLGPVLDRTPDLLAPGVVRLVEAGRALSGAELGRIERRRTALWRTLAEYFQRVDVLVTPCNSTPPYSLHDSAAESTVDWGSFSLAPVLGLPSISVPGGFTADGMPAGLQITGRPGADLQVLQVAHAYERLTSFWRRSPALP